MTRTEIIKKFENLYDVMDTNDGYYSDGYQRKLYCDDVSFWIKALKESKHVARGRVQGQMESANEIWGQIRAESKIN